MHPMIWLGLNIAMLLMLSFYSMMEMASVSFNKVRLQYYVSKGFKRAIWLNFLLQNPSRLFGTTLIGVNVALLVGSECSREFHASLGINPDLAPLSQVIIVVIFGELAPMFAARRYAEHVAMLGIPLIYASAKLLTPLTWLIGKVAHLVNKMTGGQESHGDIFISRDELQKIIEEQDEESPTSFGKKEVFNAIVSNIFSVREKDATKIMEPLDSIQMLPSTALVKQIYPILENSKQKYVPLYRDKLLDIIGIAIPRDLIRIPSHFPIKEYARSPWFITHDVKAMQILNQFRRNKQSAAVVLNDKGHAIGIVTLDGILEEIFGEIKMRTTDLSWQQEKQHKLLIDRTFPADTKIADFNAQFQTTLDSHGVETIAELMEKVLGHRPEEGESLYIDPFELTVREASLLEVKSINIKSKFF